MKAVVGEETSNAGEHAYMDWSTSSSKHHGARHCECPWRLFFGTVAMLTFDYDMYIHKYWVQMQRLPLLQVCD